jgi:uncharacterized protein
MTDITADRLSRPTTAFADQSLLARGPLRAMARVLHEQAAGGDQRALVLIDDATGGPIDLELQGTREEMELRLVARARADAFRAEADHAPRVRGRPRMGVVPREVTLLPRHWEWLAAQRGGASAALRRLVDDARRADDGRATSRAAAQQAAFTFMGDMAGDAPGYEEAIRSLFAGDLDRMEAQMQQWPSDVRDHALRLARGADPHTT